ncbi:hypothetical protein ON064_04080 [Planococcus sp. A6]|uniref:hypothetical protein n=1 Tax=Planococcus sp. A6 TaxID=2992760 RepID=UPI00237BCA36|nr:hypothetical protein [Planococcus sp. A6]MDE0582224.1 hypothetical protein [Planococcus sp. A6]
MEMMKDYTDLVRIISILKNRIELVDNDLMYWLGENEDHPLWSEGARVYGLDTAAQRSDRIHSRKKELEKQLEFYEEIRDEIETNINALEGINYKIAKLRFIQGYSYREIAEILGYSYSYIRKTVSKGNKEGTVFSKTR